LPQTEFYLVLDPNEYQLSTAGLDASITLFPDLHDLNCFENHRLQPGMIVYMPPGTGHRGQNVFALIMTVPGFKPSNELYLDSDIFEQTNAHAPYNENHLQSKNYKRLEDYL
jgi:ribosomal protein L16 Arg81 hydroxylase